MTILGDPEAVSRERREESFQAWVPTLTGPFPNGQGNAGS